MHEAQYKDLPWGAVYLDHKMNQYRWLVLYIKKRRQERRRKRGRPKERKIKFQSSPSATNLHYYGTSEASHWIFIAFNKEINMPEGGKYIFHLILNFLNDISNLVKLLVCSGGGVWHREWVIAPIIDLWYQMSWALKLIESLGKCSPRTWCRTRYAHSTISKYLHAWVSAWTIFLSRQGLQ